jgi:hypothetical protein
LPFNWVYSTSESTRFLEQPKVTMLMEAFGFTFVFMQCKLACNLRRNMRVWLALFDSKFAWKDKILVVL